MANDELSLDALLNAKARLEEFTPDMPVAIYARDPQDVVDYLLMLGNTDVPSVPVFTVPAFPQRAFFIETGSYLLVVDMGLKMAVKVDSMVYGKKADSHTKIGAALVGLAKLRNGELE